MRSDGTTERVQGEAVPQCVSTPRVLFVPHALAIFDAPSTGFRWTLQEVSRAAEPRGHSLCSKQNVPPMQEEGSAVPRDRND